MSETDTQQYVEVYSTKVTRSSGEVRRVAVDVEYFDEDGSATRNKALFDVSGGVAALSGFETPIGSTVDLRVIPAAETVVRTIPGVDGVEHSFAVLEEHLNQGFHAVDNRLEMTNVPSELSEGVEMESGS